MQKFLLNILFLLILCGRSNYITREDHLKLAGRSLDPSDFFITTMYANKMHDVNVKILHLPKNMENMQQMLAKMKHTKYAMIINYQEDEED